jgi:polysaccharide chain length determinant protein (PEP-CTERM system associated)
MNFEDYLRVVLKRKWIVIASFFSVFLGAGVYMIVTPAQYKSTTTILVIPQRVPVNYVQSTVTQGVEGRLTTIEQQVTSRTMLTRVMDELGLFAQQRKAQLLEQVLEKMKKRIEIDVVQEQRRDRPPESGTMTFSISFAHEDPKLAMLAASRLASSFIGENLKSRERQAVGTSTLLNAQVKEAKEKLDAQEEKVKRYKMQHMGELPQELQSNMNALARLQEQHRTNAESIRGSEQAKLVLQSQLSLVDRGGSQAVVHADGKTEVDTSQDYAQALVAELTSRRNQLSDLTARFTERHPSVIRLRKEIDELEKKLAEVPASLRRSSDADKSASGSRTYSPLSGKGVEEVRHLKSQIASVQSELAALKREREGIQRKIAFVQAKVDQAPRREQEMLALTHDFENLKKSYDELFKKKQDADIAQELETRQQGEQFQILDPANLPETPFKPKWLVVLAITLLAGFSLGIGGAIGLEKMDLSLSGVTDFKHYFDLPILACIPVLESKEVDQRNGFRRKAFLAGIVSFAFVLFALLIVFGQQIRDLLNN